jgi:hypothetical protein
MFTLQTSFKPLLLKGRSGVKFVSKGDCEQQGGNCPNYIQEFGLWLGEMRSLLCSYDNFKGRVYVIVKQLTVNSCIEKRSVPERAVCGCSTWR